MQKNWFEALTEPKSDAIKLSRFEHMTTVISFPVPSRHLFLYQATSNRFFREFSGA